MPETTIGAGYGLAATGAELSFCVFGSVIVPLQNVPLVLVLLEPHVAP
jgi:hypothetical protein